MKIDCSSRLARSLPTNLHFNIYSIKNSISSITLPARICNEKKFTYIDFCQYTKLKSLQIGDDSFSNVNIFKIDGLKYLSRLKIGINSFTQVKGGAYYLHCNTWKIFHILNCESLESIQIGEYSFSDFAGDFHLHNLPRLQSIQIGELGSASHNFHFYSFVVRGIELILNLDFQ